MDHHKQKRGVLIPRRVEANFQKNPGIWVPRGRMLEAIYQFPSCSRKGRRQTGLLLAATQFHLHWELSKTVQLSISPFALPTKSQKSVPVFGLGPTFGIPLISSSSQNHLKHTHSACAARRSVCLHFVCTTLAEGQQITNIPPRRKHARHCCGFLKTQLVVVHMASHLYIYLPLYKMGGAPQDIVPTSQPLELLVASVAIAIDPKGPMSSNCCSLYVAHGRKIQLNCKGKVFPPIGLW